MSSDFSNINQIYLKRGGSAIETLHCEIMFYSINCSMNSRSTEVIIAKKENNLQNSVIIFYGYLFQFNKSVFGINCNFPLFFI